MTWGDTDVGTGTTVEFPSGTTFPHEVTNIAWGGMERGSVETSHLGTTGQRTFIPTDLFDPGAVTLDINFDPTLDINDAISKAAGIVTITFTDGTSTSTWASTGFMTSFDFSAPFEEKMTGTAVWKFDGQSLITVSTS